MKQCEWCNKHVDELIDYKDVIGENHHICKACKEDADNCICRKCGQVTDPSVMIDGLCMNCIQARMLEKSRKREEIQLGTDKELLKQVSSDVVLTDQDYENWLTLRNFGEKGRRKDTKELRRIWIMIKFNAANIYDNETISKNFNDIETILDRNFSKLIGNKCKLILGTTPEARKTIRGSEVIDYENEVYIVQV